MTSRSTSKPLQGGSDDSAEVNAFDDINSLVKLPPDWANRTQPSPANHLQPESRDANQGKATETLSSLPQASFNYINSIVGSGVIGIPYALHRAGFGLGLFLLVIVAVITDYSLILMHAGFNANSHSSIHRDTSTPTGTMAKS
uniref:Putative sodium-coupled neutral amino acid transporter 11 n=1 Tax=Anopheles culicifacies TaxID=139723 RepID=A0A182M5G7_9DIPT